MRLDTTGLIKEHVHFLKIDTQGHEYQVLKGAEGLLKGKNPIDIIHMEFSPGLLRQQGTDPGELLEYITSFGYICFDCDVFHTPKFTTMKHGLKEYADNFHKWMYKGGEHGAWTDILCTI